MALSDVPHYLQLVAHDLEVFKVISKANSGSADLSDWQCTLLFYMACIYVKALGRMRNKDLQDHYQLKQWLNETPDLVSITRSYRKLEDSSRDARYEGRKFNGDEMKRILRWFRDARDGLVALLKSGGATNAPVVDPASWL